MGLDFTWEGAVIGIGGTPTAHWSYSGFHFFRARLAKAIGIDLEAMPGFIRLPKFMWPPGWAPQSWDTVDDDIKLLINHSDCDGELTPEECAKVAPRLEAIIATWPDDAEHEHDKYHGALLARNMRECVRLDTPLIFC